MDQIEFAGPFGVLLLLPDTAVHTVGKELGPVCAIQGLRLMPDMSIAEGGTFDVLLKPGSYGQQDLTRDEEVLALLCRHAHAWKTLLFFGLPKPGRRCSAGGLDKHYS